MTKEVHCKIGEALADKAQLAEHRPEDWKVTGLILIYGTSLSCGTGPHLGACERQPIDVSLFHPPFPSL